MSSKDEGHLEIHLMGRSYRVQCPVNEQEGLLRAVEFLSQRLSEIAGHTKASGDRLIMMVALNLAHELLRFKDNASKAPQEERISALVAKIDAAVKIIASDDPKKHEGKN